MYFIVVSVPDRRCGDMPHLDNVAPGGAISTGRNHLSRRDDLDASQQLCGMAPLWSAPNCGVMVLLPASINNRGLSMTSRPALRPVAALLTTLLCAAGAAPAMAQGSAQSLLDNSWVFNLGAFIVK